MFNELFDELMKLSEAKDVFTSNDIGVHVSGKFIKNIPVRMNAMIKFLQEYVGKIPSLNKFIDRCKDFRDNPPKVETGADFILKKGKHKLSEIPKWISSPLWMKIGGETYIMLSNELDMPPEAKEKGLKRVFVKPYETTGELPRKAKKIYTFDPDTDVEVLKDVPYYGAGEKSKDTKYLDEYYAIDDEIVAELQRHTEDGLAWIYDEEGNIRLVKEEDMDKYVDVY